LVSRQCNIALRDFSRDAAGQVNDIATYWVAPLTRLETCEADESPASVTCTFKLKHEAHNQGILQISDGNDEVTPALAQDYERTLPCSTINPSFTSTAINNVDQTEGFAHLKQVARSAYAKFFSQVAPSSNSGVRLYTDDDLPDLFYGSSFAAYNDVTNSIQFEPDYIRPDVLWHEYGHHVANMYGNFSDFDCDYNVNDGNALDEAVGTATALVTLATAYSATYGAGRRSGLANKFENPHSSVHGTHSYSQALCDSANSSDSAIAKAAPYWMAASFAHPFWELLSNRNCALQTCDETHAHFRSVGGIVIPTSEVAYENAIAKSLAYALANTPSSISFNSIIACMKSSWIGTFTPVQRTRMCEIFNHHGFTHPC
jgi:hypothetical protein